MESKKRSLKITLSTGHSKATEVQNLLKSTFDPLKSYLTEAANVASRVKQTKQKKDEYATLKDNINMAVLEVLEEVSEDNK